MVSKNQRLRKVWVTVDASEEVRVQVELFEGIDGFESYGFFNLGCGDFLLLFHVWC